MFVNMNPVCTPVFLFVGSAVVRVSIKDVNDNEPYFEQELYTASVREDSFTGQSIITIEAKDRDGQSKRLSFYGPCIWPWGSKT